MMVELQSCASLRNASALCCAIEKEVKGDNSVNIIAEISAELQSEKQKNEELMHRISILEAQIQERNKDSMVTNGQVVCKNSRSKCIRKFKKQKIDQRTKMDSEMKCESLRNKDMNEQDQLVNCLSMEDTPSLLSEKLKDSDFSAKDDSDDEYSENLEDKDLHDVKEQFLKDDTFDEKDTYLSGICNDHSEAKIIRETIEDLEEKILRPRRNLVDNAGESKKPSKGTENFEGCGNILQKMPPKIAFCPKEVNRMLDSEMLLMKNAQAHTIRKILVFASLGTRHGCDDMYELDFNHFSILQKGEPYVSPLNPGEHVLYENPGVRRKIFYPNRKNPMICPVRVLEEERAMRPSDLTCPLCLFLCIKYGGQTRNLPQNEYVRQRMGRNKLKSFGPVICRMAMLVHIRRGSFFFKALGITLLFMAGFPDDIVQRETKYRNLDLLQKYYRRDEDAEGEELFLAQPLNNDNNASTESNKKIQKMIPRESKSQKHTSSRPHEKSSNAQSAPGLSPPIEFKLMGYGSTQVCSTTTVQSIPSHQPIADTFPIPNTTVTPIGGANISYHNQSPCPMFPVVYWPPLNAISACSYASPHSFEYHAAGNYIPFYPHPYYSHPSRIPLNHRLVNDTANTNTVQANADTDFGSSTSSTKPKEE